MITKTTPKAKTKKTSRLADTNTNGTKPHDDVPNTDGIKGSFYEKNKHLIGSLSSNVTDLSSNKDHMKGFGRSRNANNL